MARSILTAPLGAAVIVTQAIVAGSSTADTVKDFYQGKTITIVVPGGAGSTLGVYCQLMAVHWTAKIPANPSMVCQYRPGAGGTVAAAYMYNAAPKDGTVVGEILSASVLAPKLRPMRFDPEKIIWLGSIAPKPAVLTIWHTAPAKTLKDIKTTEVVIGATGPGSESFIIPTLLNRAIGTKFKIVSGYPGTTPISVAMERGEVHGRWASWQEWVAVKADWQQAGYLIHLVQYGPQIRELPNVPHLRDVLLSEDEKKMVDFIEISQNVGMGFYLPPSVPADRVSALRSSFEAVMKDEAFLADAKKRQADVEPIKGEELERLTAKAYATPEPVLRKLRAMLGFPETF